MKSLLIINPVSGNGKTKELLKHVRKNKSLLPDVFISNFPENILSELNKIKDYDLYIIAGGDGTINEVINSLLKVNENRKITIAVLPYGSGNDFVRNFDNIIFDKNKDINSIFDNYSLINSDVGYLKIIEENNNHINRYFINNVGIGFDAAVSNSKNTIFNKFSFFSYYLSLLFNLIRLKYYKLNSMDNDLLEEDFLLISIGNGISSGGGFNLTPDAKINDGYLDVCKIIKVNRLKIIQNLFKVIKGSHGMLNEVELTKFNNYRTFKFNQSVPVHADGEILTLNAVSVDISIIKNKLSILTR